MAEREENRRRIERHKRRMRAQLISYGILVLLLVLVAAGVTLGVGKLMEVLSSHAGESPAAEEEAEQEEPVPTGVIKQPEPVEEEPAPEEESSARDDELLEVIRGMSLEDRVSQLFFLTPEQLTGVDQVTQAGDGTKAALDAAPVGGLLYHSANITSEQQLQDMLSGTVNMSKYRLFFAVEELGGEAHSEVSKAGLMDMRPSPAEIGASGDTQAAYDAGTSIGASLGNLGFNTEWGPCADLSLLIDGNLVSDISYGSDPGVVSEMLASMVRGLKDGNIYSCLKYFPGEGSVSADPAQGMASSERGREELSAGELAVYRAGIEAGAEIVLVGNASYPNVVGDNTPACLSPVITSDLLRGELGYQGIVIAGPLNEAAVSAYYASAEAAVKALQAGADMVFCPENFEEARQGVLDAIGEGKLSEDEINQCLLRIYRVKYPE